MSQNHEIDDDLIDELTGEQSLPALPTGKTVAKKESIKSIDYNLPDKQIEKYRADYMALSIPKEVGPDAETQAFAVKQALKDINKTSLDLEKARKSANQPLVAQQRANNGEAKRIEALLLPIKQHLSVELVQHQNRIDAVAEAESRSNQQRIEQRIATLGRAGFTFNGTDATWEQPGISGLVINDEDMRSIDDEGWKQFAETAEQQYQDQQAEVARQAAVREAENEASQKLIRDQQAEIEQMRALLAKSAVAHPPEAAPTLPVAVYHNKRGSMSFLSEGSEERIVGYDDHYKPSDDYREKPITDEERAIYEPSVRGQGDETGSHIEEPVEESDPYVKLFNLSPETETTSKAPSLVKILADALVEARAEIEYLCRLNYTGKAQAAMWAQHEKNSNMQRINAALELAKGQF